MKAVLGEYLGSMFIGGALVVIYKACVSLTLLGFLLSQPRAQLSAGSSLLVVLVIIIGSKLNMAESQNNTTLSSSVAEHRG